MVSRHGYVLAREDYVLSCNGHILVNKDCILGRECNVLFCRGHPLLCVKVILQPLLNNYCLVRVNGLGVRRLYDVFTEICLDNYDGAIK